MSDPVSTDSPNDELDRALFAAGRGESMPSARKNALFASLGVGAGVAAAGALSATKVATVAAGTSTALGASAPSVATKVGVALFAKWLVVGVGCVALASVATIALHPGPLATPAPTSSTHVPTDSVGSNAHAASPREPAATATGTPHENASASAASALPPTNAPAKAALATTTVHEPTNAATRTLTAPTTVTGVNAPRVAAPALDGPRSAPEPTAVGATAGPSAAPTAETPPKSPRSSLVEELALVDAARTALLRGSLAEADAALTSHGKTFPSGLLAEEAAVLRIDVLSRRGDHGGAKRAALAFLATYPSSAHAKRMRSYAGEPK